MPKASPPTRQYWLLLDKTPVGPFDYATVQAKFAAGEITLKTPARASSSGPWVPLETLAAAQLAPLDGLYSARRDEATRLSAQTVLTPPAQAQAQTKSAAQPTLARPRQRGWLTVLLGGGLLLALILTIMFWPGEESGKDSAKGTQTTEKGQTPADVKEELSTEKVERPGKDYVLVRTKWAGKEFIHKKPDEVQFQFIDEADVRKKNKPGAITHTHRGDYSVRGDTVTMRFRIKQGSRYERLTYIGQIKDGHITGEGRVDGGATWKFQVTQVHK